MTAPACSDEEFIRLFRLGGASDTAKALGIGLRNVYERRRNIEKNYGAVIDSPNTVASADIATRITMDIHDGIVMVGSDHHYWPGIVTTAHRAFVKLTKQMKPCVVVANGDVMDGSSISRHPPIGWEKSPSLKEEIEACKDRLGEIEMASGKAERIWTRGNHDSRLETKLATAVPEFAEVDGAALMDHFPLWTPCWSFWINDDVVIKHRFKGGIHATHNNTLWSGKTIVTGHLHSLKVTPFSDYNPRTRFGVDTGTMADPYGPQFGYNEDNARNHRSGFIVLTFVGGKLMWPEICHVIGEGEVEFRGKVIAV